MVAFAVKLWHACGDDPRPLQLIDQQQQYEIKNRRPTIIERARNCSYSREEALLRVLKRRAMLHDLEVSRYAVDNPRQHSGVNIGVE
jgi:hypothetical protein